MVQIIEVHGSQTAHSICLLPSKMIRNGAQVLVILQKFLTKMQTNSLVIFCVLNIAENTHTKRQNQVILSLQPIVQPPAPVCPA